MAGSSIDLPVAGDRVELVSCNDPYTRIAPGTKGTVTGVGEPLRFFNNEIQVHVHWDDGSRLSLIQSVDRYRIIERVMD